MKMTLFVTMATLLPGLFLMQANGGMTVAVIDFDRAISEAPGGKEAITKITEFQNEQIKEITTKQREADDIENRLRVQGPTLSEAARTQLTKNLDTTRTSIQTLQEQAQKKLAEMRQELLTPVEQKTAKALSTYAEERGVKIVLDASVLQSGLVYVNPTADITTEIIRRIAADLQTPKEMQAANRHERLMNRNWMDLGGEF
jgi:Skp family chaperone for outer membrane proteins